MRRRRSIGTGRRQLTWFDRAGKQLGTVGAPDESELVAPSLSKDGRRVVAHRTLQGNTDIWILDADGVRLMIRSQLGGNYDLDVSDEAVRAEIRQMVESIRFER